MMAVTPMGRPKIQQNQSAGWLASSKNMPTLASASKCQRLGPFTKVSLSSTLMQCRRRTTAILPSAPSSTSSLIFWFTGSWRIW